MIIHVDAEQAKEHYALGKKVEFQIAGSRTWVPCNEQCQWHDTFEGQDINYRIVTP